MSIPRSTQAGDATTVSTRLWVALIVLTAVMAATLIWGVLTGDFSTEGAALMAMPWGVVSVVEIYVGMALFAGWILWREGTLMRAAPWMLAIALIGNVVSCIYVLFALRDAGGSMTRLWMGARAAKHDD